MAEALHSAFLQDAFDRLASPQVVDFFRQRKPDETLLHKLKTNLRSIDAVADDAEQKQLRDPHVRDWLLEVKDAVFDAEDLLAEIDCEHTRSQVEAEYKVPNIIDSTLSSFNSKIGSGMKEVLGKLENLASQKSDLGLEKATNLGVGSGSKVSQKLESTHLVVENVIYGRDYDKKIIFDWLTSKTDNHNQLSILSVVGMGGLGKTTLAQHVFNDPRLEDLKFDVKAWVCVSDDFDVLKVTRTILEEITDSRDDSRNLGMVHRRLKEKLSGKKFLLVLDDVWIERQKECEAVLTPLNHGALGSRILVTTRNESVAFNMRSCKVHHLRQLEGDDCRQVFTEHAFQGDNPQLDPKINEIATQIVAKCNGLPLALASIGSLLHTKSSIAEWRSVLLSNIWDLTEENSEIIPALFLSYCHLPSHLKRCFAFCALFPKDYKFDKEELILLWMAEGFLQCRQQGQSPLEVGEIYFDDLLSRSFFQQSSRSKRYFNMHDLHNDLAKYVCGDICFRMGVDTTTSMSKTTRHFSFAIEGCSHLFHLSQSLTDAKRLRTFIPTDWIRSIYWSCGIPINELLSKFKYLRVLSLSRYSLLEELPEAVSKLKYLCSLDLSKTDIKRLPDSTCLLYNLQILKLNYCYSLEELPSNLHKLTNLCCLEFRHTKVRAMPVPLEKLKNLQVLSTFCVGKSSESSIQQLGGVNLEGELSIKELQNIVNPLDALAADLKNKTQLVELAFEWDSNHIPDAPKKDRQVLENLEPSKYVKDLSICYYGGTELANWLSNNSLSNMVSIKLTNCKYCVRLPSLGLLPSLKVLSISGFDEIVIIGAEFYGSSSCPFPSLKKLSFGDMKVWEEWECTFAFQRLQSLSIRYCPKLKGQSEQVVHVKEAEITDCEMVSMSGCSPSLEASTFPLDFFPRLCSLELSGCGNVRMISQERTHSHLKELVIDECHELESLPKRMDILLPSLTELRLYDCPKLECLPEEGLPKSISNLYIYRCPLVKERCQKPEGQDWPKIAHIQNLFIN